MIIIEIDADSEAFRDLASCTDDSVYKLRIALDEGDFKIKPNESVWSPGFKDGVTIKASGDLYTLLRDIGDIERAAAIQVTSKAR